MKAFVMFLCLAVIPVYATANSTFPITVGGDLVAANHAGLSGTVGPYQFTSATPDWVSPILTCAQGTSCNFTVWSQASPAPSDSSVMLNGTSFGTVSAYMTLTGSFLAPSGGDYVPVDSPPSIPVTVAGTMDIYQTGVEFPVTNFTFSDTGTLSLSGYSFVTDGAGTPIPPIDNFYLGSFSFSGTATDSAPAPEPGALTLLGLGLAVLFGLSVSSGRRACR